MQWNPNTTLVLYWTWGSWNTNGNDASWAGMMTDYLSNFFEPFADMVQQAVTDRVVHVLPVAAGLLELHRRIELGQMPGISSIKEFYYGAGSENQVHLNANGYYLSSLMHLGSSYRHKIAGVGTNYWMIAYFATPNAQTVTLNNAQTEVLQDIAWHVLTNYPRTTVSGIARIKADTNAPARRATCSSRPCPTAWPRCRGAPQPTTSRWHFTA